MSAHISRKVSNYARKEMEWNSITITLKEFIDNWLRDIDTLPIHQRIDVVNYKSEPERKRVASKRQGIIGSIFKGTDISEIKINERTAEERKKFPQKYESIDGGNRKRAIALFVDASNGFPVNSYENPEIGYKRFSELTTEQKNMFYDYKIRLVVFRNLNPEQKAMLWMTTNNSTPVNHQEGLNGMGDTPIANLVRELARTERSTKTHCHDLFDTKIGVQGDVLGEWLTFSPTRLTYDRLVARIATIVYNGSKPVNCDDIDIEKMYYDKNITEKEATVIRNKTVKCLDFLYHMAVQKKLETKTAKMTEDECIMLMRLWFSYCEAYENFTIDYDRYYDQWRRSWTRFIKNTNDDYGSQLIKTYDKNSNEKRERWALFKDNHGKGGVDRWLDNIKWIENRYLDRDGLIKSGILTVKKNRKTLPIELREQILISQNNKCYIDGKRLILKEAHAAHVVALADGGNNDKTNIRMVRAEHNMRMGTMNVDDYKNVYLKEASR